MNGMRKCEGKRAFVRTQVRIGVARACAVISWLVLCVERLVAVRVLHTMNIARQFSLKIRQVFGILWRQWFGLFMFCPRGYGYWVEESGDREGSISMRSGPESPGSRGGVI